MDNDEKQISKRRKSDEVSFFYGIGTLQFLEAIQKGFIDLTNDYVHNYPNTQNRHIFLTPIIPGGADTVTVCAQINSMHAHGRELFGFEFDFSRLDYVIQSIFEYNCQPTRPKLIKRSLYEFKKECLLNGIDKSKILPYLQLIKLTFKGFILEFKREILSNLVIQSEDELYKNTEYRFQFMSNKIPFNAVASYTGVGILENKFTDAYYRLLDNYRKKTLSLKKDDNDNRKIAINEFYLSQVKLIKEIRLNIHKPYMIKYLS
jgi:hypothetical protein